MHLLMIAPGQFPVPGSGSVEISMLAIARQLALKHNVTLVSRRYPGYPNIQKEGKLTLVRVRSGHPARYLSAVLDHIRSNRFDRIQVDNRPGYLPKIKEAFPETPISLFLHSMAFVSGPKEKTAIRLSLADRIVCNSRSLVNQVGDRFPEQRRVLTFVHLGVDLQRFRPPTDKERKKLRKNYKLDHAFVVVFAGRMIPRKGLPVLIRAMRLLRKKVPNAKLVIAGNSDNRYAKKMKRLARRYRVSSRFIGRLPHEAVHKVYWMGDCFVCPSQKHEAFGLVNLEAMASGLPCVASDIGGIGEIIRHRRSGFLVKSYKRPESFTRKMRRIARDKVLAAAIGAQARQEAASGFGWQTAADNLLSLYEGKAR